MRILGHGHWLKRTVLALPLIGLAGCVEYTIETTLNPDGSGAREERMNAGKNDDVDVSSDAFVEMMHVSDRNGWSHSTEVDEDGETAHVFQRHREIPSLDHWSGLTGQVRISGAPYMEADTRVGYVTLGTVRFGNEVLVVTGDGSDGSRAYTYRETFSWTNAMDVIVEFFMERLDGTVGAKYPSLSARERGEIVGFARARLWLAIDEGLIEVGNNREAELVGELVEQATEHALKIVHLRYPQEDGEFLEHALGQIFGDEFGNEDDWFEKLMEEKIPGLNLAFNTGMEFRLNMPGRVTSTNAHETDGTTLVWEFGPTDAIPGEIQVFAQSVVDGPGAS